MAVKIYFWEYEKHESKDGESYYLCTAHCMAEYYLWVCLRVKERDRRELRIINDKTLKDKHICNHLTQQLLRLLQKVI